MEDEGLHHAQEDGEGRREESPPDRAGGPAQREPRAQRVRRRDGRRAKAPAKSAARTLTIEELKPDEHNRRQGTARGGRMLVESIEAVGTGRSIVIDENNQILAGNRTVDAAAEAGVRRVRIVESDGKTLIAVRRRDLSPEDKRALALYDNRTGELAEWNPEQLAADRRDGLPLTPWFEDTELKRLLRDQSGREAKVKELETSDVADRFWIAIRGPLKQQAYALQRIREVLRELEGVDVDLGLTPEVERWP